MREKAADLNTFRQLVHAAVKLSVDTSGLPCDESQRLASGFLFKNTLTCRTILGIVDPPQGVEYGALYVPGKIYDFPSANILVRTVFETYINFYFLLLDTVAQETRNFRMLRWTRHILQERISMLEKMKSLNPQLKNMKDRYVRLTEEMKSSSYFKKLPPNKQQSYGNSHKWEDFDNLQVAESAGIHKSHVESLYKYLSNYVHSSPLAIQQVLSVESAEQANELLYNAIWLSEMFLALSIDGVGSLFEPVKIAVNKDTVMLEAISHWDQFKKLDLTSFRQ